MEYILPNIESDFDGNMHHCVCHESIRPRYWSDPSTENSVSKITSYRMTYSSSHTTWNSLPYSTSRILKRPTCSKALLRMRLIAKHDIKHALEAEGSHPSPSPSNWLIIAAMGPYIGKVMTRSFIIETLASIIKDTIKTSLTYSVRLNMSAANFHLKSRLTYLLAENIDLRYNDTENLFQALQNNKACLTKLQSMDGNMGIWAVLCKKFASPFLKRLLMGKIWAKFLSYALGFICTIQQFQLIRSWGVRILGLLWRVAYRQGIHSMRIF